LILGNTQKEDSLLNYAQANGFNYLALYNLWNIHTSSSLTNTTSAQPLANFINKAKTTYSITNIGATGESYWFFSNVIHIYNQQHNNPNHKFTVYNLEFEFWINSSVNPGGVYCTSYLQPGGFSCDTSGAFKFFRRELRRIDSLGNTIGVISETYIGWPNAGQAKAIVATCDRVLLHAYVSNQSTTYNYTKARLADLASGTVPAKIIPIFSAEPSFMGPWVQTNSPGQAFINYNTSFSGETASWKTNVSLAGYQWFAYTFMPYSLPTGVNENFSTPNFKIYPNPTSSKLKGQSETPFGRIELTNALGQMLKRLEADTDFEIETGNLENGIYFLRSENGLCQKIIISHQSE
jgi:hypothetical protein